MSGEQQSRPRTEARSRAFSLAGLEPLDAHKALNLDNGYTVETFTLLKPAIRMPPDPIQHFIDRWSRSGGAERANYVSFLNELCDLLAVPRPDPTVPDDDQNAYVFERRVVFQNPDDTQSYGRIDLYKRACFVLETKQGIEKQDEEQQLSTAGQQRQQRRLRGHGTRGSTAWNDTLLRARGQAEQYARSLTAPETRPPFLVVVDVGHTIDLYSEFTQTGGTYIPFPDAAAQRTKLTDLADPAIRDRLRAVWLDPLSLDPARRSAKVTREIAAKLAELAKSFEADRHDPHDVAQFLMRCLFTMFAEDVELLPKHGFRDMLKALDDPAQFKPMAEDLWRQMNAGGFSAYFRKRLLQFNGGLFADPSALAVNRDQLDLLIEAAGKDWRDVEPAIFGTLLERALDPVERHKLGAHYTPRAYVERLVMPTIVEPIRAEWDNVRAAAILYAQQDNRDAAVKELEAFHNRLCETRVLDPACGTGNFLYVTLEHLKRIEGEVFSTYESIAQRQMLLEGGHTVDPHQLLGIEINPRAAAIADLVLWIGYLQWHFRTRGNVNPPEPVIKNFKNIECRDALLDWTSREPLLDDNGKPVTHWDGRTTKTHPVTGEEVPDETAREISYKYNNPKKAEWPNADYVIGNPPFVGNKRMKLALGEGYVETLRDVYSEVPESVDYVMYWWNNAAELAKKGTLVQYGLITTNSITQTFNAKLIALHQESDTPVSITYAVPDHPWVDSADGADVRISMTVATSGQHAGQLDHFAGSADNAPSATQVGYINANLSVGSDVASCHRLQATKGLACPGVQLSGQGFVLSSDEAGEFSKETRAALIKAYITGRDLTQVRRTNFVIDTFGIDEDSLRKKHPDAFQRLIDRVKPERIHNPRPKYAKEWWLHSEPRRKFRQALRDIKRFIVTSRTSRHRFFELLSTNYLPETKVLIFALDDAFYLGTLSSRIHVAFANAAGGWL